MAASRSTIDPSIPPLEPPFDINGSQKEAPELKKIIQKLGLQKHIEGGYFVETDRDSFRIANPFSTQPSQNATSDQQLETRNASTSIHYLLTPESPLGAFHRNRARTVHTLHKGRGRYVIIHAADVASPSNPGGYGDDSVPESEKWTGEARVETFIVGHDVLKGERLQWIVEGGCYKSSYLLPDAEDGKHSEGGLLISETVVPGFEYSDHDFLRRERLDALVTGEQVGEMQWMLRKVD